MKTMNVSACLFCIGLLSGCLTIGNNSEDNVEGRVEIKATQLHEESWANTGNPGGARELTGLAYDSASDNLFFIKSIHNVPNNEIRRLNLGTLQAATVYSYSSQWDYGMRSIGGELFVARSYDNTILRLGQLSANTLTQVAHYCGSTNGGCPQLNNVNDLALVDNKLYFVLGNMTVSPKHNGIQYLSAPGFSSFQELVSSANSGWPVPTAVAFRSMISIGSGSSARLVTSTGYLGWSSNESSTIEMRDLSGNLLRSVNGAKLGNSYLQADSSGRVYGMAADSDGVKTIFYRWSSDLTDKEEMIVTGAPTSWRPIFVLKETSSGIEVIFTEYRGANAVFYKFTLPN